MNDNKEQYRIYSDEEIDKIKEAYLEKIAKWTMNKAVSRKTTTEKIFKESLIDWDLYSLFSDLLITIKFLLKSNNDHENREFTELLQEFCKMKLLEMARGTIDITECMNELKGMMNQPNIPTTANNIATNNIATKNIATNNPTATLKNNPTAEPTQYNPTATLKKSDQ